MKLRKCKYNVACSGDNPIWSSVHFFHRWYVKASKYGEVPMALIENQDGEMARAECINIKFLDKIKSD